MRYLVRDERVMLGYWLAKEKISLRTIAHRLNRAYSTITDEFRKVGGGYLAEIAQKMTRENLKRRGRKTTNEHLILIINRKTHFSLYLFWNLFLHPALTLVEQSSNLKFFLSCRWLCRSQ